MVSLIIAGNGEKIQDPTAARGKPALSRRQLENAAFPPYNPTHGRQRDIL